jgi:ribosomal protein S18 acetylase RimI-like enzyme
MGLRFGLSNTMTLPQAAPMPTRPYTLRPVTEDDYAWLWTLKQQTMRVYVERTWGAWDEGVQEIFFRQGFFPEKLQIIVAAGRDAGLLQVDRPGHEIFLQRIELAPECQGRGLGTAVVGDLAAEARAARLPLRLQVLKVNPAMRLYARLGLRIVGETATHLRMQLDGR